MLIFSNCTVCILYLCHKQINKAEHTCTTFSQILKLRTVNNAKVVFWQTFLRNNIYLSLLNLVSKYNVIYAFYMEYGFLKTFPKTITVAQLSEGPFG